MVNSITSFDKILTVRQL